MRGVVATWLEDRKADSKIIAGVRLATSHRFTPEDFRHALALDVDESEPTTDLSGGDRYIFVAAAKSGSRI